MVTVVQAYLLEAPTTRASGADDGWTALMIALSVVGMLAMLGAVFVGAILYRRVTADRVDPSPEFWATNVRLLVVFLACLYTNVCIACGRVFYSFHVTWFIPCYLVGESLGKRGSRVEKYQRGSKESAECADADTLIRLVVHRRKLPALLVSHGRPWERCGCLLANALVACVRSHP